MNFRKTLTETIWAEEAAGEYRTHRYDKTATAYMFGYACSSGFGGSGFSGGGGFKPFDLDLPSVVDLFNTKPKSPSSYGSAGCSSNFGSNRYNLIGTGSSFKIFNPEINSPLVRLDITPHHNMPTPHLQHLKDDYFGRSGNEAADMFADIFCSNHRIKFPWEK